MIRVLFVDDEPRVLDGLKRSLRYSVSGWHLVFAEGGRQAIEALDAEEFDVVVSDMRMPGVDGNAVLRHAQARRPDAIRIAFSGEIDCEAALLTVPVAHQFVAKPCEGEQLRRVIERAGRMRELFTDPTVRGIVSQVGTLPSSPRIYLELTKLLEDLDTSAADVAAVLEQDLSMSVKILQIVNSAFFGLSREVARMRDAVAYVGVKMIRALALSEEAFRPFEGKGAFSTADLDAVQRTGLRVGTLAREIVSNPAVADQAFLAGMLHDIGRVITGSLMPDEYREVLRRIRAGEEATLATVATLGTTYSYLGAYLLGTWGLPISVVEAVAFHRTPTRIEHDEIEVVTAVHIAAALGAKAGVGTSAGGNAAELDTSYVESMGLGGDIERWIELEARLDGLDETSDAEAAQP